MELVFIGFDILGVVLSLAYYRKGQRSSAILTLLLSALTLLRATWIRIVGAVFVILILICFILFRTALGERFLKRLGRDSTGKKIKS